MTTGTTLTLPQRAAVALGSAEHEKQLILLAEESKTITEIKNSDARLQCHTAYMKLKNARVTINKVAEDARDDATKFSKAVIAEGKRLVSIIEEEEARLQGLRDKWDAEVEAEKQRKIEEEKQRISAILERIDAIRNMPLSAVGKSCEDIGAIIYSLTGRITDETYHEYLEQVNAVRLEVLSKLAEMQTAQQGIEIEQKFARQEAERQRLIQEEAAARLAAERVELDRLRKEQAERDAAAQRERDEIEAKRRAEHEAAQAELRAAQDKINAERAELERAQAAIKQAEQDAIEAEQKFLADWDEALIRNSTLDAQAAKEEMEALAVEATMYDDFKPTALQIVGCVAYGFEVSDAQALEWLQGMDFAAVAIQERKAA